VKKGTFVFPGLQTITRYHLRSEGKAGELDFEIKLGFGMSLTQCDRI
jgi:hypothetical protein